MQICENLNQRQTFFNQISEAASDMKIQFMGTCEDKIQFDRIKYSHFNILILENQQILCAINFRNFCINSNFLSEPSKH